MTFRPFTRRTFVAGTLLIGAGAVGRVLISEAEGVKQTKLLMPDPNASGGADRYLTFVSTDKQIYRAGDKVYVRGVVLHHATHQPLPADLTVWANLQLIGPRQEIITSGRIQVVESVVGFSWQVPDGQPGGSYTAKISFPDYGHTPAERRFDIRAYRAPRLKTQLKFLRDGYGPGDEVVALLHVERAEGGLPEGARITAVARLDENEVYRGPCELDARGDCTARFRLPGSIRRGVGTLSMVVNDHGTVETASKSLPILLQTVDLTLYPEGSEIIAGIACRVYFEGRTPAQKPADLAGAVVDSAGHVVVHFRSEHEGRGRFDFTPLAGEHYALRISEPSGIDHEFPLPSLKASGATLRAAQDTFRPADPIVFEIASTHSDLVITLAKRETIVDRQEAAGRARVSFRVPETVDGVLVATVWTMDGKPLAERLVFREPAHTIRVSLSSDADQYSPGSPVRIRVRTTDERGTPTSTFVGLSVTDDSVLEMAERREQSPRLPVMVFLEDEVSELADAQIYFDPHEARSPVAIDLLLGTQGWRRFALVNWQRFLEAHADQARRALAFREPVEVVPDRHAFFGLMEAPMAGQVMDASPKMMFLDHVAFAPEPALLDAGGLEHDAVGQLVDGAGTEADDFKDLPAERDQGQASRRGDRQARPRSGFVYVRKYAHALRPGRNPAERVDFTETLFWHAGIRTNEEGEAKVEFALNDAVGTFRVLADAFSAAGAIGTGTTTLSSVRPFYIEPKLPLEVTAGDRILLPVACINATSGSLGPAKLTIDAPLAVHASDVLDTPALAAHSRRRTLVEIVVGDKPGLAKLSVTAAAGPYHDSVMRTLEVRPAGFDTQLALGGLLDRDSVVRHDLIIPADMVPGSLQTKVNVHPTPLASLTEALASLVREPYGCFEQASSTIYPLVMAQRYFLSHQGVPADLVARSTEILAGGYQRLLGFECKSGGFEWFGADPGHDALSAYGLLEFTEMAGVRRVDPALLERTRKWLLAQRDGSGTFRRQTHTLHVWLPEPELSTAYNVWALLAAGIKENLSTEIAWVRSAAQRTTNSYVKALAANILQSAGDDEQAAKLLDQLVGRQNDNGSVDGSTVSVIGSSGEALLIETTALAALAWLARPSYAPNADKAVRFLAEQCKAGRFGSTQSTILALKAILAYDKLRTRPKAPGSIELVMDDRSLGAPVDFDERTQDSLRLPKLGELSAGRHRIELQMRSGSQMPYAIAARFARRTPDSSERCRLRLKVELANAKVMEGAVTEARVEVTNQADETVPSPTAMIGVPGGLEVRHDGLKELVAAGTIAAYEVRGREVVIYWRALPAKARVEFELSLVAAIPGTYTGPASRTYLYYTAEHKHWVAGLHVDIAPLEA